MNYKKAKIAVVLPVYNGSNYLELCIKSVIQQSLTDFEFLICDDCSTDNSLNIIKMIANKYPGRIMLIENTVNKGLFKTLNLLISQTTANFIHLWAQDDIMKENCLEKVLDFHLKHSEISMSYHQVNYVNEKNKFDITKIEDNTPEIISSPLYAQICAYWGCLAGNIANVTLNKNALEVCGYFDENYIVSGDFEMWTRLVKYRPIGYLKEPLIYLRKHSGQLSRKHSSIYYSMLEDIPIQKNLLKMVGKDEIENVAMAWKWKTQVRYLNETLFLISKAEYRLAKQCLSLLSAETNIITLLLRWLLIRATRVLNISDWFYTKVLNTLKIDQNALSH